MTTINRAQRIRNFPVEPYSSWALYLLRLALLLAGLFAVVWAPAMDVHFPTLWAYRWHIAGASVVFLMVSTVLHRLGRRI